MRARYVSRDLYSENPSCLPVKTSPQKWVTTPSKREKITCVTPATNKVETSHIEDLNGLREARGRMTLLSKKDDLRFYSRLASDPPADSVSANEREYLPVTMSLQIPRANRRPRGEVGQNSGDQERTRRRSISAGERDSRSNRGTVTTKLGV